MRLCVAEREGFEPSNEFPRYTLSRRACSTTPAPLREVGAALHIMVAWTMDAMTTSLFIPLEGGFHHHGQDFVGGPPPFLPFLGASMGLLLLLLLLFRGRF